jgi:hypothetical protein
VCITLQYSRAVLRACTVCPQWVPIVLVRGLYCKCLILAFFTTLWNWMFSSQPV